MIVERIKTLMKSKGLTVERLAIKTGIGYSRWTNVLSGKAKVRYDEIQALGKAYPEHKHWIAFGETLQKAGQTRPNVAQKKPKYNNKVTPLRPKRPKKPDK